MTPELFVGRAKPYFMALKEWHKKSCPTKAVENINLSMDDEIVDLAQIIQWYMKFDNKKPDLLPSDLTISSTQSGNLHNSLLSTIYSCNFKNASFNNGQIVCSFHCSSGQKYEEQNHIIICDLFRGIKSTHVVPFLVRSPEFVLIGENLLMREFVSDEMCTLHLMKIDYADLKLTDLETIDVNANFDMHFKILTDQLDSQKFVICEKDKIRSYNVQDGKILMGNTKEKNIRTMNMYGKRLVGNKLQGFTWDQRNTANELEFCELDLETLDKEETNAPIVLDGEPFEFSRYTPCVDCWSKTRYYGLYGQKRQLLSFDPETLKWSDVKIMANIPATMFVDENEILTLQTKNRADAMSAHYRIALRSPDKLMKLALMAAAREFTLCGNDKYIKAVRQIPIEN